MIPDVTPNGVFYLPPTGWLTSFYNPPCNKDYLFIYKLFYEKSEKGKKSNQKANFNNFIKLIEEKIIII